jgi:ABC-2 type transport system permease protein
MDASTNAIEVRHLAKEYKGVTVLDDVSFTVERGSVFALLGANGSDAAAWLTFCVLLALFTLATTWLAMFFGLLAQTVEGAGAFSYVLPLLIFVSPSFVQTDSLTPVLRGFAENQPMTPIIESMRSLLTEGTPGPDIWIALAWATGMLVVSYVLAVRVYRHRAPVPAAQ